jgi:hypothetical protein
MLDEIIDSAKDLLAVKKCAVREEKFIPILLEQKPRRRGERARKNFTMREDRIAWARARACCAILYRSTANGCGRRTTARAFSSRATPAGLQAGRDIAHCLNRMSTPFVAAGLVPRAAALKPRT